MAPTRAGAVAEDPRTPVPLGAGIGTSTTVCIHRATAGNIVAGNQTVVTHPMTAAVIEGRW